MLNEKLLTMSDNHIAPQNIVTISNRSLDSCHTVSVCLLSNFKRVEIEPVATTSNFSKVTVFQTLSGRA